jgi:hypothetical protein
MRNRAIGFAIGAALGGLAATQGRISHPLDTLLGAGIWGGIFGGVVALYEKLSSRSNRQLAPTSGNSAPVSTSVNYAEDDIDGFLASLPVAPNQEDGWYSDPARSFRWRHFAGGAWSTDVSDELPETLVPHRAPESEESYDVDSAVVPRDNSIVEELERLAVLRRSGMLSDEEFRLAKERILGRSI